MKANLDKTKVKQSLSLTPEQFVQNEYRDYVTYRELAKLETVPEFKRILSSGGSSPKRKSTS